MSSVGGNAESHLAIVVATAAARGAKTQAGCGRYRRRTIAAVHKRGDHKKTKPGPSWERPGQR